MTTVWTGIAKPTGLIITSTLTMTGGTPVGLLLAITTSSITGTNSVVTSKWTNVADNTTPWVKVSNHATPWTSVPKAT